MNPKLIFDRCPEFSGFDEDAKELLDKIMKIKNPMNFDDEFATEDELQHIERELDRAALQAPQIERFKAIISSLPAVKHVKAKFI